MSPSMVRVQVLERAARPAESGPLPAVLDKIEIEGPAGVLLGWLPDLERDIREPFADAGYDTELVARLGNGFAKGLAQNGDI